ncbi:hypothetical protein Lcho_0644 [Leptothrix cholodnii SP-6]|uniref:Uncharacterized protein n=2 Tax=Leptothrix cholodnii TaxID=34029 RepID=B1XZS3_LEPCP|nr:hypothetical protein Lcho_0644 [Leptothrix cholodnii SP-6]
MFLTSCRDSFNCIEKVEMMSCDILVVSGKTNRETFWDSFTRRRKDWSRIFCQFGLNAGDQVSAEAGTS